jgi:hypothetical protein
MAEHRDLTGSSIHEPKGADTATEGQVYLSDGAGSGAWAITPGTLPVCTVVIEALSDFPTPVSSVITLEADTNYLIGCAVDIADNRLVMASNSIITGVHRNLAVLTSATTGALFSATGVDCRIARMSLNAPNASELINIDGSGTAVCRLDDSISVTHTGVGIMAANVAVLFVDNVIFVGGTDTINCSGVSNGTLVIEAVSLASYSSNGIDLGTSVWSDGAVIGRSTFSGDGGSFGITGAAGGANVAAGNEFGVNGCNFNGSGDPLQTITTQDDGWEFSRNNGIEDTHIDAHGYVVGSALATTLAASTPALINATTWVAHREDHFTASSVGRFTYTGANPITANAQGSVTGESAGTTSTFRITIAVNGVSDISSAGSSEISSSASDSITSFGIFNLVQGDYLELFVENTTSATNFEALDMNFLVSI